MIEAFSKNAHACHAVTHHGLANCRRLADEKFLPFDDGLVVLQPVIERSRQFFGIPGFMKVTKRMAGVHRVDGRLVLCVCSDKNSNNIGIELPSLFHEFDPTFSRHALIGKEQSDLVFVIDEDLIAIPSVAGSENDEVVLEGLAKVLKCFQFVIHIEHSVACVGRWCAHAGVEVSWEVAVEIDVEPVADWKIRVKRVYSPGTLSTSISPSICCIIR